MSNWKACIPANPKYEGAKNAFWVTNVSVAPHEAVSVRVQVHYQNGALANEFVSISGEEYKEWSNNDDWIYQKVATKLAQFIFAVDVRFSDRKRARSLLSRPLQPDFDTAGALLAKF